MFNFKLHLLSFFSAFFIGIAIANINIPQPEIIYMYPSINDKTIYTEKNLTNNDDNAGCFRLDAIEVECPKVIV